MIPLRLTADTQIVVTKRAVDRPALRYAGLAAVVRRKAVIDAVREGWVAMEEACRLYKLSVDEFLAWERDLHRYGIPGLRATRYQIYRQTEVRRNS